MGYLLGGGAASGADDFAYAILHTISGQSALDLGL